MVTRETFSKTMAKKWIQKAIKKPGSFSKAAKKAGKSTMEYAEEKKHAKGKIGRRARLALTLSKMHKPNPAPPYGSDGCFSARGKLGIG